MSIHFTKLDSYIQQIMSEGKVEILNECLLWLFAHGWYEIVIFIAEQLLPFYENEYIVLETLGMAYYYTQHYELSFTLFQKLLSFYHLSDYQVKMCIFNQHFSIPHIQHRYESGSSLEIQQNFHMSVDLNHHPIPRSIIMPFITFSITTCKRLDLFKRTMQSFLHSCTDAFLISKWICIDDNSSVEDREEMQRLYPFFEFYFKDPSEKGHPKSMNLLYEKVDTPFLFHMEDDWVFFQRDHYLGKCLEVLNEKKEYGQCLINRNYAETHEDIKILGGENKMAKTTRYVVHTHSPEEEFQKQYGIGPNCGYWPHFSLRPGLWKTSFLKEIGKFNETCPHFEMEYAYRYHEKNYQTCFLEGIYSIHIGRLTKDRNDDSQINAYTLNHEIQFGEKRPTLETIPEEPEEALEEIQETPRETPWEEPVEEPVEESLEEPVEESLEPQETLDKVYVINLSTRPDRWEKFLSLVPDENRGLLTRWNAVNGYELQPTRRLEQLFNGNDYNFRKGMIGCALSHLYLWEQLCDSSQETILILEDDSEIIPDFFDKIQSILKNSSSTDWDVIFIGHHAFNRAHYLEVDKEIQQGIRTLEIEKHSTFSSFQMSAGGTGGYLLRKTGAEKLLQWVHEKGMIHGIDTMMQHACDDHHIYYTSQLLFHSEWATPRNMDVIDTDIQKNYDSLTRSTEMKLRNDIDLFREKGWNYTIYHMNSGKLSREKISIFRCFHPPDPEFHWYEIDKKIWIFIPKSFPWEEYGMNVQGKWDIKGMIKT